MTPPGTPPRTATHMPSNRGSVTRRTQGLPTYLEGETTAQSIREGSVQRSVQGSRQREVEGVPAYPYGYATIPSSAEDAAPVVVGEDGSIYVDGSLPGAAVVQYDAERDAILVDDTSVNRPYVVDRSHYGLEDRREPRDVGSPGSHVSQQSRSSTVERIVSLPFPSARASLLPSERERARPDERDDIIRELRTSISRLQGTARSLEGQRESIKAANARAAEDSTQLKVEIARLTKMLDEERAVTQVNLGSEEAKRREAFELVDLQRKLLLQKDEEVRQLAQLAASHKEQIFVLHSHLASSDINSILGDSFDFRTIDTAALDPDCRQRVMELMRGPTIDLSRGSVFVDDQKLAYAVDAADGVLDGRINGRPIMVPKAKPRAVKSSGYGQRSSTTSSSKVSELKKQLSDARQERERLGEKYR
eukprot:GGOE01053361.1.p1 GENE.GGOE01053361.1~~GGOE01053361.1.p1  ORF type:complete len:420 (+),score=103.85 GGOE01053361.1:857-2116(+)